MQKNLHFYKMWNVGSLKTDSEDLYNGDLSKFGHKKWHFHVVITLLGSWKSKLKKWVFGSFLGWKSAKNEVFRPAFIVGKSRFSQGDLLPKSEFLGDFWDFLVFSSHIVEEFLKWSLPYINEILHFFHVFHTFRNFDRRLLMYFFHFWPAFIVGFS